MPVQVEQWFERKVHTIIQFLNARNVFAAEIHHHQVEIYGEDVMSWQSNKMMHPPSNWNSHGEL
jgi:hypothetical protein